MFCPNCGAKLEDDSLFCSECGTSVDGPIDEASSDEKTQFVESGLDFGGGSTVESLEETSDPFAASGSSGAAAVAAPVDTTFVAPDGQPAATFTASNAAPATPGKQSGGSKTVLVVAIVAVVAVLAVAAFAFFMLRPQASATYDIQFETDGGTAIAAQQVEEGAQVTSPSNPTKNGYEFAGWYSNPECTDKVTFPLSVDEDTVLYAKWEEKEEVKSSSSSSIGGVSATVGSSSSASDSSTVKLTVTGADGTTRTADIRRSGSTERVLPESNARVYTDSEIASLSDAELCIAWNEIIAANSGYVFKNSGLNDYFNSCSWYSPSGGSGNAPGGVAGENVAKLKARLSDSWWTNLATY